MRKNIITAAILTASVMLSACSPAIPEAMATTSEAETTALETEESSEEETTAFELEVVVPETEESAKEEEETTQEETTEAAENNEAETYKYFCTVTSGGIFGAPGAIEQCLDLCVDKGKSARAVIYQVQGDKNRGNIEQEFPYYDRTAADKMQELFYGPGLPEIVDTYCSASLGGGRSYLTVLPELEAVIIESAEGVFQIYAKDTSADLEKLGSLLATNINPI